MREPQLATVELRPGQANNLRCRLEMLSWTLAGAVGAVRIMETVSDKSGDARIHGFLKGCFPVN